MLLLEALWQEAARYSPGGRRDPGHASELAVQGIRTDFRARQPMQFHWLHGLNTFTPSNVHCIVKLLKMLFKMKKK